MKCIRIVADGTVTRIGDFEAHNLVKSKEANYCPKKEWREETRDKKVVRFAAKPNVIPKPNPVDVLDSQAHDSIVENGKPVHGLKAKERRAKDSKKKSKKD